MKLAEIKAHLKDMDILTFQLEDGSIVPEHFHVTEVGEITKNFIDCGGVVRHEKVVNFQLWSSDDVHHRLGAEKLLSIIQLSEDKLGIGNLPIEVEYQGQTIGKYGLELADGKFLLTNKQTDCLAKDKCEVPSAMMELSQANTCTPGGGCC